MDVRVQAARRVWRAGLALGGCVGLAPIVHAGAWTQPAGQGLQITTTSLERGDFGESWSNSFLAEQGFSSNWGGHLKFETRSRIAETTDQREALEIGVRRAFAMGERSVVSFQGAWLGAESLKGPQCEGSGYELRTAAGTSRAFGDRNAFVNIEAAWRSRGDLCEGRLFEIAGGIDLSERWRVLAKAWSDRSDGDASDKIEAMLFRDIGDLSVGLGYRREISGAFNESGWVASVWTRF